MKRTKTPKFTSQKTKIEDKKYTLPELKKLMTEKQKRFCHEYVRNGWNATQAYLKVYPGVTYGSAMATGSQNLRKPMICQYLEFIKDDYEALCGVSKAKQVAEYYKIAYSTIGNLYKDWMVLEDFNELKEKHPEYLELIESIETKTENKMNEDKELIAVNYVKIKMYSRLAALAKIDELMGYKSADKLQVTMEQPLFPES
jgi:phage terminase small subunit